MFKPILFLSFLFSTLSIYSQNQNIAQRLGYPADAKLLIIHADDLGVAHSQNRATFEQLKSGPVNSASIMVPCPWFQEVVANAQKNQSLDLGLHLTLTSEWKYYKWAPISSKDSVSSLLDDNGYFFPEVPEFVTHAKTEEVEAEMRNQIKKAYRSGIDVTHLDAHMGAAVSTADFAGAYMKLGKEFNLPVLLDARVFAMDNPLIKSLLDEKTIIIDHIYTILPEQFLKGSRSYYSDLLNNLPSGLNCLLIHLAFDDSEMQGITIDHPEWGAAWRQADFDFFNSPECAQLIKENNIILVTWRELRDKIVRSE
ncbi:MAG: polysaccharide deacetylase family protein [Maribacter sp.]|nr:polysaccharide deacetylase family protein [Maribacter sp.]